MFYEQIAAVIHKYDIPRSTVAKLSGMWLTDLSAWLNRGQGLKPEREHRVAQTVSDIVRVIESLPMKIDLRDPQNVLACIRAVNDAEMQMELFEKAAVS